MSEEKTISPEMAFTIISTLRDQIEIQKMRIRKLKQQKQQREELLKECKEMLKKSITYQCMDRANHYIKKIENDIYEPTLAKIDEVLK